MVGAGKLIVSCAHDAALVGGGRLITSWVQDAAVAGAVAGRRRSADWMGAPLGRCRGPPPPQVIRLAYV